MALSRRKVVGAGLAIGAILILAAQLPAPTEQAAGTVRSSRTVIGTSVRGRSIVAVHRWRPGASKRVLVIGSIHGDETAGLKVIDRLMAATPPADVDVWLIPTANPDGNAARTRRNARRVDLNRNLPYDWRRSDPASRTYSGPRPASEPETRALMAFVSRYHPRITVVLHQPLFGVDSEGTKALPVAEELARRTGLPLKPMLCGSACRGTFTGWHNRYTPGRAVTVELGATASSLRLDWVASAVLKVGSEYGDVS